MSTEATNHDKKMIFQVIGEFKRRIASENAEPIYPVKVIEAARQYGIIIKTEKQAYDD